MYAQNMGMPGMPAIWGASGIGDYRNTGDWTWEFDPAPYDFLAPADSAVMPPPVIAPGAFSGGLSGCGGGCGCGGRCSDGCGLGQTGLFGTNLFESMDISTWGFGEWGAIAVGAYLLVSLMSDTKSVAKSVSKSSKARRRSKASALRAQARELAS
jgi:hypothetical protein